MPGNAYVKPGLFTTRLFNPAVAFLARRLGVGMKGAHVLSVRGRKTGDWHSTPVNPLGVAGQRYLVAPRGETQWVRNIRVSREARLHPGRRTETVYVEEVADSEKPPSSAPPGVGLGGQGVFGGVDADAPDDVLARLAPAHPIFRILP